MAKVINGVVVHEDGDSRKGLYYDLSPVKQDDSDDLQTLAKAGTRNPSILRKRLGNLPAGMKYVDDTDSSESYEIINGQKVPRTAVIKPGGTVVVQKEGDHRGDLCEVRKVHNYDTGKITVDVIGGNNDKHRGLRYVLENFNEYAITSSVHWEIDINDPLVEKFKK